MTDPMRLERRVTELERRLAALMLYGTVEEVDADRARMRVRYADGDPPGVTAWIPWLASAAGELSAWRAPSPGEQMILLSPGGEPGQGTALPGLYSDDRPAPDADPARTALHFPDGAQIAYDPGAGELSVLLPAGAALRIEAPGGASLEGDLAVDGDIGATGGVSAKGDVSDRRGSMEAMRTTFNAHVHPIAPGGAILPTTTKMS